MKEKIDVKKVKYKEEKHQAKEERKVMKKNWEKKD